jgi:antirestriction protein ArdC
MKDVYQTITDHIVNNVDDAGNWKPCWHNANPGMPTNAATGNRYQGTNIISCWVTAMCQGYTSQEWGTYKQWQSLDCHVKKGEKGTPIVFYKRYESTDPGEDDLIFARGSHVFNGEQVEGYVPVEQRDLPILSEEDRIESIERWVDAISLEAIIEHSAKPKAYYAPARDTIHMPNYGLFHGAEHYYSTLFHELTHWTGSKSRLDRPFRQEKSDYAKEELVAELGAAFLCAEFGISSTTRDDHTTYIASWLKALKDDKRLIITAASKANQAAALLNGIACERHEQMSAPMEEAA